jgi:perosamine synthetase
MDRIPVSGPWITEKEIRYVTDAVTNAWYSQANVYHERFERAFANYIGVPYAVALPSCTSAIHLVLMSLGVGPGDEVIVPDCTWIASAAPISYVGATPVFADIDAQTWCLSPLSVQACITPRTKAIIAVDLYGNIADWDGLSEVAQRNRVPIIEDAAEAVGAEYRGRKAGAFGDAGVFSFHGSKTLTTGEGGMLVTHRKDVYDRVLFLRDHGRPPGDRLFYNTEVAYKYKMSSMQAALGLAQLERVEELVQRKREIFSWYAEALKHQGMLCLNHEAPGTKSVYWMVTAIFEPKLEWRKENLMERLSQRLIDTRPFFHPLSSLPAYSRSAESERARARNFASYCVSPYGINLPSGLNLRESDVRRVTDMIQLILSESSQHRP